jgi:proline iminopeptidase
MKSKQTLLMLALTVLLFASCTKERFIDQPGNLVPKTVDQDASLPSIIVNGARLHAEAFGPSDSTLIIVLHGGPGADYRYLLNCRDLAALGYRVVFYDQRGSGLSQRFSQKSYTSLGIGALNLMYDDLSGVIAHYRTSRKQKVFLIGHSWGGMLATGYAARHPDAVQGLVVCEPGGLKWDDVAEYVTKPLSFNLWGEAFSDAAYIDQFLSGKEDQHEVLDYKLTLLASKNEITGDDYTAPGSFWRGGAVINTALFKVGQAYHPDFSAGISQFGKPVLFFYSEKNKAYPDSWAHYISGAFSTVDLFKVPGVGHDGIISDKTAWAQKTLPKMLSYFNSL